MKKTFLEALYEIADFSEIDRVPIATIKRGAGDPANNYYSVLRFLGAYIPENQNDTNYFTLATLFSLYPTTSAESEKAVSLGIILKRVKTKLGEDGSKSFELKVNRLLNCDSDDLPRLLAVMFRYLKGQDVGKINYEKLFSAIRYWNSADEFVQKQWAKEFWTNNYDNKNNELNNESNQNISEK